MLMVGTASTSLSGASRAAAWTTNASLMERTAGTIWLARMTEFMCTVADTYEDFPKSHVGKRESVISQCAVLPPVCDQVHGRHHVHCEHTRQWSAPRESCSTRREVGLQRTLLLMVLEHSCIWAELVLLRRGVESRVTLRSFRGAVNVRCGLTCQWGR